MNDYTEDNLIEQPTMELLASIGWETMNCYHETFGKDGMLGRETPSDVVLVRTLKEAIKRLNPGVDLEAVDLAVEEITKDRSSMSPLRANKEIYKLLKDGVEVTYRDEHDEDVDGTVAIMDWKNPENNTCFAVNQFWVSGIYHKRRADIVCFINGIPLILIELKASHKNIANAYNDNLRDYKDTIPQLFWYNGLIILSNGSQSSVGSITSTLEHFNEWKKVDSEKDTAKVSLEAMIRGVCGHEKLLDILENFVLYKDDSIKIIPKNHQFHGVNNAIEAVREIKDRKGKLGVFWHTQGSGKSFSMIFFTQKIRRKLPGNWTFIVVTDRADLDRQIYGNFASVEMAEEECQAKNCEGLRKLLKEDHSMVFTLIQKFQWEDVAKPVTLRKDVIVITDEAHRSQYDTLAANMRKALPNASFIGFTGTPLMEGDTITREVFGDYVSVYDFSAAVEDGATVPLYYENRIPELQLKNEDLNDDLNRVIDEAVLDEEQEARLEREFLKQYHLITREDRLDKIAEDIVRHFMNRGYQGKAMVVSIDKLTAVKMYQKVGQAWQNYLEDLKKSFKKAKGKEKEILEIQIQYMEETDMAVIVSSSQNEIDDFRKKGIDILPIRKRMQTGSLEDNFKKPEHPLRVVFVCAMWITGFDVQSLSTVYLDKPMRNHTLMQTIARANRVFKDKASGLIVDYVGVFRNLKKALSIYAKSASGKMEVPVKDKKQLLNDLAEAIKKADEFCKNLGIDLTKISKASTKSFQRVGLMDEAVDILVANEEDKKTFLQYGSLIWRIYKATLPDDAAEQYEEACHLTHALVKKIKVLVEPPNIDHVMGDIERVLDMSIDAEGYVISEESSTTVDLSGLDFDKMRREFAKKRKHTEIQKLKNQIEQVLHDMLEQNRTRIDYLERFEEMINEYNSGSKNVDIIYNDLVNFAQALTEEQQRHVKEQLSEEELAIFDILVKPEIALSDKEVIQVKKTTKTLLTILKSKLVLDWRKKQQARAEILYTIEKILDDDLPRTFSVELYRSKCELIYQHIYDNYFGNEQSRYTSTNV